MSFKQKNRIRNKKIPVYKKPLFIAIGVALLLLTVGGTLALLELNGVIDLYKKRYPGMATQPTTPTRSSGQNTKGEDKSSSNSSGTGTSTSTNSDSDNSKRSTETTKELITPTGTFVSNHRPNIDGDPSPNEIQSSCVTTSGATCTIVFTKGSTTKQLPVQNTDLEGATYWSWNIKDVGLTAGTWKIQAKAQLGGQTKIADDALDLEVSP